MAKHGLPTNRYALYALAAVAVAILLAWALPPPPIRVAQLLVAGLLGWMAGALRSRRVTAAPFKPLSDDSTVKVSRHQHIPTTDAVGRKRVLIVDDDAVLRKLVRRTLEADFDVSEAENGSRALDLLADDPVDVVLLDFLMPGMSGLDVLKEIRSRDETRCLPVIMCTARDSGDDVIRAMRLGASDYCVKPFDKADLEERIAVLLDCAQGQRIGDYRLGQLLGKGGMGVVYRARHAFTGHVVALKLVRRGLGDCGEYAERFARESRLAARVNHPNVVGVEGFGVSHNGTRYLVMELVEGRSLEELAREGLGAAEVTKITLGIARGLEALERQGILHRDMKPSNVVVTDDGVPKILDFGIARELEGDVDLTRIGVALGSLAYASPAQLIGELDPRADVYGLGATVFFACLGRRPFLVGRDLDKLLADKNMGIDPLRDERPDIPAELDRLIQAMLNPNQRERPTMVDVLAALDAIRLSGGDEREQLQHPSISAAS